MEIKSSDKCPECCSGELIQDYNTSETVCSRCGLIVRQQEMDRGPERRSYTLEELKQRTRTGPPNSPNLHDRGMGTTFNPNERGTNKKVDKRQMLRLKKWQVYSRVQGAGERNLALAMNELTLISEKLTIPKSVKEEAAVIYRKTLKKRLTRGRSISVMTAAALYTACRFAKTPKTLKEIAKASLINKKEIAHCYRFLLKELNIKIPISNLTVCISKIAGGIGISEPTQGVAVRILHQAQEKRFISGKGPMGVAAATLYIACLLNEESRTQKDIAYAAGVTEVTIRNRYKEIVKKLNLEIPDKEDKKVSSTEIPIKKKLIPEKPITGIHDIEYESISVIAERANVSKETQKLATEILRKAKKEHVPIRGKNPKGLIAAILLIACQQINEVNKQKAIAEAAEVSQGTIGHYCWYLRLKLKLVKPKWGRHKRADSNRSFFYSC
ncbi:MAG: TFIIB-type zinc ribbon-containing protein [Patescibacteria group bacterium]